MRVTVKGTSAAADLVRHTPVKTLRLNIADMQRRGERKEKRSERGRERRRERRREKKREECR